MKMILPIKSTYVAHWGLWEAVREVVQNGKDEEDQNGSRFTCTHDKGILTVRNEGAQMDRKVLLLGQTSKEGTDLRGHFGEGLNLAMLAAVRGGSVFTIKTQHETWTPAIETSSQYGDEKVLVVNVAKRKANLPSVEVKISVPTEDWAVFKKRFLFLTDTEVVKSYTGAILMDPEFIGQLYVKGIWAMTHRDVKGYGFDFANVGLDRDRCMINAWDLEYSMAAMLREALAANPKAFQTKVYDLIESGAIEARSLKHQLDKGSAALAAVVAEFESRHGEGALPVKNMAESRELDHFGRTGVVVPGLLGEVLEKQAGTFGTIQAELKKETVKRYSWQDLGSDEQAMITWGEGLMRDIEVQELSLVIADFNDADLEGLTKMDTREITISRRCLTSPIRYLGVLVHEAAHAITGANDGEKAHVSMIETLWAKLYSKLLA